MHLVPQQETLGYCNQAVCLRAPPRPLDCGWGVFAIIMRFLGGIL